MRVLADEELIYESLALIKAIITIKRRLYSKTLSLVMSQNCVAWPGSRGEGYKNRDFPAAPPAPSPQSDFPCEPGEFSVSFSITWDAAVGAEWGNDSMSEL